MRLHRLWLRAFGPFAAEQEIDFERLGASGLFLLEGPTGAGKTTILDAITFALYGTVSGETGGSDRLHSDFAEAGVEPRVELEFSLRGVRHRIGRVPEYQRRKKRGEGVTTEPSSVHLERHQEGEWTSLSSNKAEAGGLITEIVGLTREQFTQVALLPQGEFARFLRSGDDDRRELLTRLFGTQLYDQVTDELERRRSEAERRRREAQVRITTAVSAAVEAAGLDGAAAAAVLSLPPAGRVVRLAELESGLAAAARASQDELARAQSVLAKSRQASDQAAERAALLARRAAAGRALAEHDATRSAHGDRERRLAAARRAEPIRPLIELLDEAEETTRGSRTAVIALVSLTEPGLVPEAELWQGRGRAELEARAAAQERLTVELRPLVESERKLPALRAALNDADREAEAAAGDDAALRKVAADLPAEIDRLEKGLDAARVTAATSEALSARAAEVEARRAAAGRLAALRPRLARKRSERDEAVAEHQRAVDQYQRLIQMRLDGMAGELAAQLIDGEPCAVCGATSHPAPAATEQDAVCDEDVNLAREGRDAAQAGRERIQAEFDELDRDEAAQAALTAGQTEAGLAALAAELSESLRLATEAAGEVESLREQLAAVREEVSQLGEAIVESAKRATSLAGQAARERAGLTAEQDAVARAAAGHQSVELRLRALEVAVQRDRELAIALGTLAAAIADESGKREHAGRQLRSADFTDLTQARSAVLPAPDQETLAREVTSWLNAAAVLTQAATETGFIACQAASAGQREPAVTDPVPADAVASAQAEATEAAGHAQVAAAEQAVAGAAEQEARRLLDTAASRVRRFTQRLADVEAARKESDDLIAATAAEIRLANLAKGMDGHRRVALTTYVLRHWFGQVVAAANGRLDAMSSGRYELRRTDEAQSKRQRTGLTLTVIDRHTGEERSPASLSGGETFYTSLSLALGLADVVKAEAGGIDLDTLFIDEGFGSLDPETLDQVMAVVDDLRNGGRVVGVVSHVADLKDRIGERLEVRRTKTGASAVKLVA